MRRATAALLGTVTGTALLVGAKYGASPASGVGVSNSSSLAGPAAGGAAGAPDPATGNGGGSGTPSASATPVPGVASAAPTPAKTTVGTGTSTGKTAPAAQAAPACTTATGDAASVSKPGIGAVTVTIKACGGAISTASGTLSQSNWSKNTSAIPGLNTMAVQYYKTNFSQIHYSGASLTSAAYQASLKSAMTKAGI